MPNHIHIIWEIVEPHTRETVQRDFLKYTSQQLLFRLRAERPDVVNRFCVNAKDRRHQIWQRGALSVLLYSDALMEQKIRYIHNNPVAKKWKLAASPEGYLYSSAAFYLNNSRTFDFITDFRDW